MSGLVDFFRTDPSYKAEVLRYKPADGLLALTLFVIQMAAYYLMGVLQAKTGVYLGIPVSLFFVAVCVVFVLIRKNNLSSLGFHRKNAGKSALTGLVIGVGAVFVMLAGGLLNGKPFAPAETIIRQFFYYLVIIALPEEIVYRGYIQSRLFGLIKSNIGATATAGVLFVVMHIPYHMGAAGANLIAYCRENWSWFIMLFGRHLVITYLYRRFNSNLAPTVLHGLLDWSNILFT